MLKYIFKKRLLHTRVTEFTTRAFAYTHKRSKTHRPAPRPLPVPWIRLRAGHPL